MEPARVEYVVTVQAVHEWREGEVELTVDLAATTDPLPRVGDQYQLVPVDSHE